MNTVQLDQGTILTRIRSEKYPGINCYGILITASCDIARRKVQKYYYITALDAKQWLTSEPGFRESFGQVIKTLSEQLEAHSKEFLDPKTLMGFSVEAAKNAIEQAKPPESDKKKYKKLKKLLEVYENYSKYEHFNMTVEDRCAAIRHCEGTRKLFDMVTTVLNEIGQGRRFHYYYLPIKAYSDCDESSEGLIADFQELGFLYLQDLERIKSPGFDPYSLNSEHMEEIGYSPDDYARYNKIFYMDDTNEEAPDNNVNVAGKIRSPWREHFMQRLSFSFSRIGLDDIKNEDFQDLLHSVR